jgi:Glycosyltransferase family 87
MTPRLEAARSARTGVWIVLLVLMLGYALHEAHGDFPYQYAFDLYHPWGIARAAEAPGAPSNPYRQTAELGAFAHAAAESSDSVALRAASGFWHARNPAVGFEPTGTPLYYATLSLLPAGFDVAHLLMTVLQFASLGAAIVILARLRNWRWLPTLCLAALALCTFNPFTQDVKFANAASVQTACIAALVMLAQRGRLEASALGDRGFLAALALLVLFKPNTALIAAALAASYHVTRGTRRFMQGALVASVTALLAVALSCWRFHDPSIWLDWFRYTQGANGGTLLYTAADGNLSLVKMLSERGSSYGVAGYSMLAALVFALLAAAGITQMGRAPQRLIPGLRAVVGDAWLVASAGVLGTLLVSPLVWPHYYVLLVVPMLRFIAWDGRWDASTALTVVAWLALSRLPLQLLLHVAPAAIYIFMVFSWMPLLAALFIQMARAARASMPGDEAVLAPALHRGGPAS